MLYMPPLPYIACMVPCKPRMLVILLVFAEVLSTGGKMAYNIHFKSLSSAKIISAMLSEENFMCFHFEMFVIFLFLGLFLFYH